MESDGGADVTTRTFILGVGQSNVSGLAVNAEADARELAPRADLQILNNTSLLFEDLDVGTNNLIDSATQTNNATHGIEIGLANAAEDGQFGSKPVYLVKAGQGGTSIADWDVGTNAWNKCVARTNAALGILQGLSITPRPIVFYQQGEADSFLNTPAADWKTKTSALFARVRTLLGDPNALIVMAQLSASYTAYNGYIAELAAAETNVRLLANANLARIDGVHWTHASFMTIAQMFVHEVRTPIPMVTVGGLPLRIGNGALSA